MTPILSILIPSIPSRREMAAALYDKLADEVAMHKLTDVEILMLVDNKQRSIGLKRQALVDVALGDYLCFVDDDDDVEPGYVYPIWVAANYRPAPDVIVFDSLCSIDQNPPVLVSHSIENTNEQYSPAGFKRAPWHIHAWRKELAKAAKFPDLNYGEDWPWCEQMLKSVTSERRAIGRPLYHYRFNHQITEAR